MLDNSQPVPKTDLLDSSFGICTQLRSLMEKPVQDGSETCFYHTSEADRSFVNDLLSVFGNHIEKVSGQLKDKIFYSEENRQMDFSESLKNMCMRYITGKTTIEDLSDLMSESLSKYKEVDKAQKCIANLSTDKLGKTLSSVEYMVARFKEIKDPHNRLAELQRSYYRHNDFAKEYKRYVNLLVSMNPNPYGGFNRVESTGSHADTVYSKIFAIFTAAIEDTKQEIKEKERADILLLNESLRELNE